MGRFSSPDPSGLTFADPTNPQSLNLYSYVLNNPLAFVDPDGLECVWDDGSFDSKDDAQTGSQAGCSVAGGTYADPQAFSQLNAGDWSNQADSNLANVATALGSSSTDVTVNADGSGSVDETGMDLSSFGLTLHTNDSSWSPHPITELALDVTADSNHMIGCIAQAYGAGAPGETLRYLGQPVEGSKPFVGNASKGTSPISEFLSAQGWKVPKGARFPAPTGGPFTGKNFAMKGSRNLGRQLGRWAPIVGWAADIYAVAQLGRCL